MPTTKAWDEIRNRRVSGVSLGRAGAFLRSELPKARRIAAELVKSRTPIEFRPSRFDLLARLGQETTKQD